MIICFLSSFLSCMSTFYSNCFHITPYSKFKFPNFCHLLSEFWEEIGEKSSFDRFSLYLGINKNFGLLLGSYHSNSNIVSKLQQKEEKSLLEVEKDNFWTISLHQVCEKLENPQPSNSVPRINYIILFIPQNVYKSI